MVSLAGMVVLEMRRSNRMGCILEAELTGPADMGVQLFKCLV